MINIFIIGSYVPSRHSIIILGWPQNSFRVFCINTLQKKTILQKKIMGDQ